MINENLEVVESAEIDPVENTEIANASAEGTDQVETADNTEQTETVDPIKSAQERAGKKIAAQRKLYSEQVERLKQENEQLKQQAAFATTQSTDGQQVDPSRLIYDAKTERYFDIDSPIGTQVWREQEAEKKSKVKDVQKQYEQTAEKILQGQAVYDDFDDALMTFQAHGTNDIATALVGAEDPAKLVHYLGNNPNELSRLNQLSPMQVQREIVKLEFALQNTKKLVTNAKAPVNHLSEPKNKTMPHDAMSYEDRAAYWQKQINGD